jgi:hypothetical protein
MLIFTGLWLQCSKRARVCKLLINACVICGNHSYRWDFSKFSPLNFQQVFHCVGFGVLTAAAKTSGALRQNTWRYNSWAVPLVHTKSTYSDRHGIVVPRIPEVPGSKFISNIRFIVIFFGSSKKFTHNHFLPHPAIDDTKSTQLENPS